jgi:hypothetical protein
MQATPLDSRPHLLISWPSMSAMTSSLSGPADRKRCPSGSHAHDATDSRWWLQPGSTAAGRQAAQQPVCYAHATVTHAASGVYNSTALQPTHVTLLLLPLPCSGPPQAARLTYDGMRQATMLCVKRMVAQSAAQHAYMCRSLRRSPAVPTALQQPPTQLSNKGHHFMPAHLYVCRSR